MSKMWERTEFWPVERRECEPGETDFTRGAAEARRTVEAELAGEREALLQLASALEVLQSPSAALIASLIVAAVERLVVDIAGNAPIDRDLLRERADALAAMVSEQGEVVLAVHPEDADFFGDTVAVVGDPALPRGTVQARTAANMHEDGVVPALDRLRAEIARLGLVT